MVLPVTDYQPPNQHLVLAMEIVHKVQQWVSDTKTPVSDWASPTELALIDALDAFEHPSSSARGAQCRYDAAFDKYGDLEGRYVCTRVPQHRGPHRYKALKDLIAEIP